MSAPQQGDWVMVPREPHTGKNYEAGLWSRRNWEAALEDQAAAPKQAEPQHAAEPVAWRKSELGYVVEALRAAQKADTRVEQSAALADLLAWTSNRLSVDEPRRPAVTQDEVERLERDLEAYKSACDTNDAGFIDRMQDEIERLTRDLTTYINIAKEEGERADKAEAERDLHYNRLAGLLFSGALDDVKGGQFRQWEAEYINALAEVEALRALLLDVRDLVPRQAAEVIDAELAKRVKGVFG